MRGDDYMVNLNNFDIAKDDFSILVSNLNNETCYFNGLIKSLDIGISKKSINKFKINRDFDLFFCCQVFNFIYYTQKITFKEYFYTIKK